MNARAERALEIGSAIVTEARVEKITFLAGSIAYHAFVSMLPLMLLLLAAISTLGNQSLEDGFLSLVEAVLTPGAQEVLLPELESAGASTGLSIVGGLILVWGTLRIFRGLDTAFSDIYETEAENSFTDQLSDGLIVLVTFAVGIGVAIAISSFIPLHSDGPVMWFVSRAVFVVSLTLVLFPMYYIFPDTDVSVVEVLPGTILASVGLVAFETGFRIYSSGPDRTLIGGILLLLTWLYFGGLVLLFGVVVNAVLSNRSKDVSIDPVFGGVPRAAKRDKPGRDAVVGSLTELERLLATGEEITFTVDGESVTLPPPQQYETQTHAKRFSIGDRDVGVELRWSPTDERTVPEVTED